MLTSIILHDDHDDHDERLDPPQWALGRTSFPSLIHWEKSANICLTVMDLLNISHISLHVERLCISTTKALLKCYGSTICLPSRSSATIINGNNVSHEGDAFIDALMYKADDKELSSQARCHIPSLLILLLRRYVSMHESWMTRHPAFSASIWLRPFGGSGLPYIGKFHWEEYQLISNRWKCHRQRLSSCPRCRCYLNYKINHSMDFLRAFANISIPLEVSTVGSWHLFVC